MRQLPEQTEMFHSGSSSSSTHASRWVDNRHGQVQQTPHGHHGHNGQHDQHGQHGQQGRRVHTIVSSNLKTELCRNFEKGLCTYGDRCAFAHGREELKYRTLREMQNAGRIPDAVKYRCIPCMTWVATGSCPYSTRCVFIHDPRVQGRQEAWLYAGSHMSSAYHSSDSAFFFPDLPRDPDSLLPRDSSLYDLDPAMCNAPNRADRSVYNMWYSFVSVLTNLEARKASTTSAFTKTLTIDTLSPSSTSSGSSTTSLSERSVSFGSNFSTSPPTSISPSSSRSSSTGRGGHFTSTMGASSSAAKRRDSRAAEQHEAGEHRLCFGGCPRLESFVNLGRGIPIVPPTPTSLGVLMEGFPSDRTLAATLSKKHHVTTVPYSHSPGGYYGDGDRGGGGVMRKALLSRYREASPPRQRPAPAEYLRTTSAPPRRTVDKLKVYGYEARDSPRDATARLGLLSATESCERPHYKHHRHNPSPGRTIMATPARTLIPPAPAFEAQLREYARQPYRPHPEAERRRDPRLHRPESVRMVALDLGNKGASMSQPARVPFVLLG
eukprot:g14914.t1